MSAEPTGELRERMRALGRAGAQAKRIAAIERRIRELVDAAPPLTPSQRERLATLLHTNDAA